MGIPVGLSSASWSMPEPIRQTALHLCEEFADGYPEAASVATLDPHAAVGLMRDLALIYVDAPPSGACALGAVYDDGTEPARILLRPSGNEARDNFTTLHEVGHHLLARDETWQYDVRPHLMQDQRRPVEESIVDCFASEMLIPQGLVDETFATGVTARGVWKLADECTASLAACCVRAAHHPGRHLVLIADLEGRVLFSAHGGGPYPPKRNMTQPAISVAASRTANNESYTLVGNHGIIYSTGNTYTDVSFDAHRRDHLLVCVVTPTRTDRRVDYGESSTGDCDRCSATFATTASSGFCARCDMWKCPDCHTCGCTKPTPVCDVCWLEVSALEAQRGLVRHEDCS